ncbi:hypothetical protein [Streptomyces sp. NPDC051286]|uniref:nSTAND1 domain-containing NTPase n=1 Tax=Streptomyces sp. NPDC051286 TaxID=3365647 RepID=UPI0037B24F4D
MAPRPPSHVRCIPRCAGRRAAAEELVAATDSHAALSVILVMRDDFYPRLAALAPQLMEAAAPGLLNVPATLSVRELQAIITRPAHTAGVRIEDGLTERIITDVLAADPHGRHRSRCSRPWNWP